MTQHIAKTRATAARARLLWLSAGWMALAAPGLAQTETGLIALPQTQSSGVLSESGPLPVARITLPFADAPAPAGTTATTAAPADSPIQLFGPRVAAIPAPPVAADVAAETVPVAVTIPESIAGMWPFESGPTRGTSFRFSGERDSAVFTLFAPADDMPQDLVLSTISSAFVKPDSSSARVFVGETEIGTFPLTAIQKAAEIRFPLPSGLVRPGRNLLRLELTQAHRHFCGDEAAYDLWTDIDMAASGLAYRPDLLTPRPTSFLSAVAKARAEGRALKVRVPDGFSRMSVLPEVVAAMNTAMGGSLQFRVVTGPIGNAGASPEIVISEAGTASFDFQAGPGGQQLLNLRLDQDGVPAELTETLGAAVATESPKLIPTDLPVLVSAIGLGNTAISDHLWDQFATFRLADDWMIGTNAQAELKLDVAYVSGLPDGARLRFLVNGKVVRVIPFDLAGRDTDTPLVVRFDASRLHAGRNTIGFEVSVPGTVADEACPIEKPTLAVLGPDTTLTVPGSPSMHLPGINRAMAAMTTTSMRIFDRGPDAAVDDFLTLAGALPETNLRETEARPTLTLLRATDIKPEHFGSFAASAKMFADALRRTPVILARQEQEEDSFDDTQTFEVAVADEFSLFDITSAMLGAEDMISDAQKSAAAALAQAKTYAFPNGAADLEAWLSSQTAEAILFQLSPERPEAVYLVVDEEADVTKVASALSDSMTTGAPLSGHVAVLDRRGDWSFWTDYTRAPMLEEEITLNNWHGVAGNYASQRPLLYLGGIIAVVLISALLASSYMVSTRSER